MKNMFKKKPLTYDEKLIKYYRFLSKHHEALERCFPSSAKYISYKRTQLNTIRRDIYQFQRLVDKAWEQLEKNNGELERIINIIKSRENNYAKDIATVARSEA